MGFWKEIKKAFKKIQPIVDPVGYFRDKAYDAAWKKIKHWLVPDMRQNREAMVNGSQTPRRIIYGRCRVGSQIAYACTSGGSNEYLNLIVIFAGHAVTSIDELWLDDTLATDAKFSGLVSYTLYDGTQTAACQPMIDASGGQWTADHKLLGCAYAFVQLKYSETVFPGGLPAIKAVIKGRPVYDPRTGLTAYSTNAALCSHDYMMLAPQYGGMGCEAGEVNVDSVVTAANRCDESVATLDGTEPRYSCNGAMDIDGTPAQLLAAIMQAMDGEALYNEGAWSIFAGGPTAVQADVIDESWLNGSISLQTGANKSNRVNMVTGSYINPLDHWAEADFPTVSVAEYVADDMEELTLDLSFNFVTSGYQAQRQARLAMELTRRGLMVTYPCNLRALKVKVNEVYKVSNAVLGWSEKLFKVVNWTWNINGGVELTLAEYDATVYDANVLDLKPLPLPPRTNLPTPWAVAAPANLQITEELYATVTIASFKSRLLLTWSATQASATSFDVALDGVVIQTISGTTYTINDLEPGYYDVAVRSRNALGAVSAWVTIHQQVIGKAAPPADVTNLIATINSDGLLLSWDGIADVDRDVYLIRTGSTSWDSGYPAGETKDTSKAMGLLVSGVYSYTVKATDTSGNYSLHAISCNVTIHNPTQPVVSASLSGSDCTLSWQDCTTDFAIDRYEIRYGASFDAGVTVTTTKSLSLKIPATWTGSRTFWVRAVDAGNNPGTAGSVDVAISAPAAPNVSATLSGVSCNLSWSVPSSTMPIDGYEIRIGATWATATSLATIKTTAYSVTAAWSAATLWVAAIDANGTPGTPGSVSVNVAMPTVFGMAADVIDNNVLLRWTGTKGSLNIDHYDIRKGLTWAGGAVVGSASGTFSLMFESTAGTYVYWVAAVDAAGNQGTPVSLAATVNQPPDYILNVNWTSALAGTKTNIINDPIAGWTAMVTTGQTWATHFTTNSKTTIQQFIDAGYTKYLQPSAASASYVETFDYGTTLAGTKITVALNHYAVIGTPVVDCKIETSPDNSTWTAFNGVWQAYGTAFRYVRVTLTWSASGQAIDHISDLTVRLDSKIRNDAGMGTVTTAATGVAVPFNVQFVDVASITVTAAGTTAKYAIYDFVDAPYPTSFTVYLLDAAGNKTTGSFSWSARGY